MKKQTKKLPAFKKALTYLSAALLSTSSGVALAKPSENFTQVYTFGDSFAFGWSPYFTKKLGFQFTDNQNNFATGGAGTSYLATEIANYKNNVGSFDPNALYIVDPLSSEDSTQAFNFALIDDNTILGAADALSFNDNIVNSTNYPNLFASLERTSNYIGQAVSSIHEGGARYIIVFNHYNDSLRQFAYSDDETGNKIAELINQAVYDGIAANAPNANVIYVDYKKLVDSLLANPNMYLTTNEQLLGNYVGLNGQTGVFSGDHPTAPVYKITADLVSSIVNSPTRIALLREIPLTLGMKSGQRALTFAQNFTGTGQLKNNVAAGDADSQFSVEVSGDFTNSRTGNFSNRQLGFDADTWDGAITLNYKPMDSLAVGMTLDYADTKTKLANNYGKAKIREVALSLHGVYSLEQLTSQPIFVYADAGMGKLKYKTHRYTPQGIATVVNTGSPSGNHYFGTFGTGYRLDVHENMNLTPFAAMHIQSVSMKAFSEKENNHTKMSFSSPKRQSVQGEVGLTVAGKFDAMNNVAVTPSLTVSYLHEWKDPLKKQVRGRHTDMPRDFAAPAYHIEESGMQIQGNVTAAFCNQYTVGLNASAKPTGRVKNYSVGLNAGINF